MDFGLEDNYPNPFNPETTIGYDLPEKSRVILTIIDVLGRELYRLVDAEQAPGHHEVQWDGRTTEGTAASGVYLYRLQAGSFEKVKKMALLR
ncbi:MAG: FlgD immunoglobulin-like domain containing protein [bacterium]